MAASKKEVASAREVLDANRDAAQRLAQTSGTKRTLELLAASQRDLEKRLKEAEGLRGPGKDSFTATQLRATLAQVRAVQVQLNRGLKGLLLDQGPKAGAMGAEGTARYLAAADKAYRGVGTQPLALDLARMLGAGEDGSERSILARLGSFAGDETHPAREGILMRYGMEVVANFEKTLQRGFVAKKSLAEMRDDITEDSPFLQGAPAHWATRIVRTELAGAHNRGQWEAIRDADDQLGDMVKILSAVFDDLTASDSYACHGQIRRPEEAFEMWQGFFQHPPARPNDREAVTPHRIAWAIPPYLEWRDDDEIRARWEAEQPKKSKVKREMPERPLMTTVPLEQFGQPPPAPSSPTTSDEPDPEPGDDDQS